MGETSVVKSPPISMLDFTSRQANEMDNASLPEHEQALLSTPSNKRARSRLCNLTWVNTIIIPKSCECH